MFALINGSSMCSMVSGSGISLGFEISKEFYRRATEEMLKPDEQMKFF